MGRYFCPFFIFAGYISKIKNADYLFGAKGLFNRSKSAIIKKNKKVPRGAEKSAERKLCDFDPLT